MERDVTRKVPHLCIMHHKLHTAIIKRILSRIQMCVCFVCISCTLYIFIHLYTSLYSVLQDQGRIATSLRTYLELVCSLSCIMPSWPVHNILHKRLCQQSRFFPSVSVAQDARNFSAEAKKSDSSDSYIVHFVCKHPQLVFEHYVNYI